VGRYTLEFSIYLKEEGKGDITKKTLKENEKIN
jgi:hypothetical protein